MVSFSTTSKTGPGLSKSAWQLGAKRLELSVCSDRHAVPHGRQPSIYCAYIHEAASRSSSSSRSLFLSRRHRSAASRSACTRQRVSSVCHGPRLSCFTTFRRANRSQELRLYRASCVSPAVLLSAASKFKLRSSSPPNLLYKYEMAHCQLLQAPGVALQTPPAREHSDSPQRAPLKHAA